MPSRTVEKLGDTEEYGVVRFHLRGREVVIREMPAEEYEEALRSAAVIDEDGKATDRTDMLVFEKLMAIGSVEIDGKSVDLEDWGGSKDRWFTYPVTNRILNEVKRLHWVDIETDEEKQAREKALREQAKKKPGAKQAESDVPNS